MKPIVEYSDFRQYMRDYYDERKRRSVFSWREFSKIAGFTSSSYMKVVCDGKSKLSRIGVERTGQAMGLVGFEMDYFRAMVEYGQTETEAKKKAAYENMLAIARVHKIRVMEGELFEFYDSWHNPVVRAAADVQKSLNFLTRVGLLKREGRDAFVQAETSIAGTPDATRLALRGMHRQMSKLATPAVDLPVDERHFSGVTMGLSRRSYERIASLIDEFRRQVIAVAAEDKDIDQVYRLNLQLFPLSRKVKECENEEV